MKWLFTDNPTPQQIKNRILFKRWKRKMYKKFRPDDVVFPFVIGLLIFGLIVMIALQGVA